MDYKLVERMYQEAVESSLSSSSTNQVDDQVKYLTSRLLQEMGLIGSNRSSSSTSTSTTTTHGDEIHEQEHEQQEKQKQQQQQQQQQAAILALYELNFGLSHYDDPLISTSPINRTTTTPISITSTGDDDMSSTTLVPLQGTREKKKIPATVVAPIAGVAVDDTNAISCSLLSCYSTTSTLTLSSSTWNDDDSMWRPWNVSNHSTR